MLVTEVEGEDVVVRYADPDHAASKVRVWAHLRLGDTTMHEVAGGWELRLTDLPVDRLEYLIDVDGDLRPDPSNPRVVPGPFGDHSWVPLPAYREPAWVTARVGLDGLDQRPAADQRPGADQRPAADQRPGADQRPAADQGPAAGQREAVSLSRTGAGRIDAEIWSPADTSPHEPLSLLVCHDGPEMDAYGGLTAYVAAMVAAGTLPPIRVALVSPGPRRNKRYAANPAYARALTNRLLPALTDAAATSGRPVLMGQSLGALAALHAMWTSPGTWGGAFLQSGSFFTAELDPQESGFEYWREVTGFVASVHAASRAAPDAPPTTLVCGTAEENHANNLAMRDHLTAVGVETGWGEVRDGHTWTCWRDTLDPHLTELLGRAWT